MTAPAETLIAKGLVREGYDQVMANPPFHVEGTVRPAPDAGRAAAHIMEAGALESWVRFLATFTAPKGRITLIHMPQALPELLPLLDRRFGAVTLFPLFPKDGEPAVRVILQARKGSRAGMRLLRASCCTRPTDATRQRPRRCCGMGERLSSAIRERRRAAALGG